MKLGIKLHPQLLLLAPFLATLVLFVPNLRIVRDLTLAPESFAMTGAAMMLSCLVTAIAATVYATKQHRVIRLSTTVALISAGIYVLSHITLWVLSLYYQQASEVITFLLGLIMGVSVVPLFVLWGELYEYDLRTTLFHGALSGILAVVLIILISFMNAVIAAFTWCICAALGAFTPAVQTRKSPDQDNAIDENDPQTVGYRGFSASIVELLSTIWLPLLGMFVCVTCSSMAEVSLNGHILRGEFYGLIVAAMLAVIICLIRTKAPLTLVIEYIAIPSLVIAAVVLASFPAGTLLFTIAAYLVFVPTMFVSLYAIASVAVIRGLSRVFVAGTTVATCCFGMLVGSVLNIAFSQEGLTGQLTNIFLTLFYAAVMGKTVFTLWRVSLESDQVKAVPDTAPEPPLSVSEVMQQPQTDAFAQTYGFTPREREIFDYLKQGYNSRSIANALLISENTVRTHMKNIYHKCNVSTREELLVLVNKS